MWIRASSLKGPCECQLRTKCARNLLCKTPMWEKMGGWAEGHQENLGESSDDTYSLTLKEGGRESWVETSYTIVQTQKVLAKLLGSSQHKVSHQRRPLSSRNRSALVSLSCSVIGWEQFMGNVASVQTQGCLPEHSSCGPSSVHSLQLTVYRMYTHAHHTVNHKPHLFSGILALW